MKKNMINTIAIIVIAASIFGQCIAVCAQNINPASANNNISATTSVSEISEYTYDEYAFGLDITWGGTARSVDIEISVNGNTIYKETNCSSHTRFA